MNMVIFLHVSKTGGLSIRNAIGRNIQQVLSHEDSNEKSAFSVKKANYKYIAQYNEWDIKLYESVKKMKQSIGNG